jgi:uroporphyrinogen decarboxylase
MDLRPIERMNGVWGGQAVDRRPWIPSVYEHGARLLEKSPGEVSRSAALMAEATLAAYRIYQHDLVTVGIDIYNIEAEALGCTVSDGVDKSIPGVTHHPLAQGELNPDALTIPGPGPGNRLGLIVEATRRVIDRIGHEVWVYACMGGPFSQAVELRGFEALIADILERPTAVHALLDRTAQLSTEQACRLSAAGAGVNLFESWATLPLIDPTIFQDFVVPYHRRVIEAVRSRYQTPPPAVILGGDTARLIDFFLHTGAGLIAADYMTDFAFMRARIGKARMIIRGCVDPKLMEREDWSRLTPMIDQLARRAAGMARFAWGCGCVSYDTLPQSVLRFKQLALAADARTEKRTS